MAKVFAESTERKSRPCRTASNVATPCPGPLPGHVHPVSHDMAAGPNISPGTVPGPPKKPCGTKPKCPYGNFAGPSWTLAVFRETSMRSSTRDQMSKPRGHFFRPAGVVLYPRCVPPTPQPARFSGSRDVTPFHLRSPVFAFRLGRPFMVRGRGNRSLRGTALHSRIRPGLGEATPAMDEEDAYQPRAGPSPFGGAGRSDSKTKDDSFYDTPSRGSRSISPGTVPGPRAEEALRDETKVPVWELCRTLLDACGLQRDRHFRNKR
ncbi:hypothetical protein QBC39DRAFT_106227 [Podospora conica]|nr:hypothetical protein QBC39DRAFT_106227 [Schizothecium conicum]